ncbi:MAG: FHA domain-containing protein, partial [Myxococcales bacterium]|nr:FHA domain-containing protein [Myxococcales bacterium]
MAEETKTVPKKLGGYPVRAVRVEVAEGRDKGKRIDSGGSDDGSERIRVGTAPGNELLLSDPTVSRFHLEIVRRADRLLLVDHHSTNGTRIGPVTLRGAECEIAPGATVVVGETTLVVDEGRVVMLDLGSSAGFGGVLGRSPSIRRLTASLEKLAENDAP